jgi:hypothetical protein
VSQLTPPECRAFQALVPDLLAGELESEVAEAVEGHASTCPACGPILAAERQVRDLVRAHASREVAPASLRERVGGLLTARRGLRGRLASLLGTPGRAAAASAALATLLLAPSLYLLLAPRAEPIHVLTQASLAEHSRAALSRGWRAEWPDRGALLGYLRETLGLPLERLFVGDPDLELLEVYPSVVMGEKGVAILYRDRTGRTSTLLVLPGRGLEIPARNRMQIETFRPYLARADRHNLLIWKQGDLAYSLVSEQEEAALARVYLKIRKAP